MTDKASIPSNHQLQPCWLSVGDGEWRCRECGHRVHRGSYPTHLGHAPTCSYSAALIIERAEKAEAEIERLTRERDEALERIGRLQLVGSRIASERDRLRTALVSISTEAEGLEDAEWVRNRVGRALHTISQVETAASNHAVAPCMVDGIRHRARCDCLHTPAGEAARRPCNCGAVETSASRAEGRCETRISEASGRVFRCTSWAGHPGGCQEWDLEPGATVSPEKTSGEQS